MLIPFDQLFKRHRIKSAQALHLGANLGQEAAAYAQHGIKEVIWVEALPEVHLALKRNLAGYPGSIALQACLSETDGEEVTFHIASNQAQSSSFLEFGTHSKEHPTVTYVRDVKMKTIRLDTLLAKNEIQIKPGSFLNVDLQGAELLALKGMGGLLSYFDHVYIEVNTKHLYKGCPLVEEIDDYLHGWRFVGKEIKMTGSGWGDKFYSRI